jgi:hypothetical protein
MLNKDLRILDFDASLTRQDVFLNKFKPRIVDFISLGPACRMWMNSAQASVIQSKLDPSLKSCPTFIGSGDFHHISALLAGQFDEPISMIVFDHHPDWDIMPPHLACGSWVSYLLKNANIKNIILLGISSEDISEDSIWTANLAALKNDRLQIYPYWHGPTKVLLRNVPANRSINIKRGLFSNTIRWQELREKSLPEFLHNLISNLDTKQTYVSIDKDCLNSHAALTNWEEGSFALDDLLDLLKIIRARTDIVGLDVTGEFSKPLCSGRIKSIFSDIDHPKYYSARGKDISEIDSVNQRTNIRIVEALFG